MRVGRQKIKQEKHFTDFSYFPSEIRNIIACITRPERTEDVTDERKMMEQMNRKKGEIC